MLDMMLETWLLADTHSGLATVMFLGSASSDNPSIACAWYSTHILSREEESSKT